MRRFRYVEPLHDHHDEPLTITVSEEWIIKMYLPYWWTMMLKAGKNPDSPHALSDCIHDFCAVNWAEAL